MRRKLLFTVLFLSLLPCACTMGPHMLSHTPLEYNKSAQLTQNKQMLMNLVRTKYLEQPFFLQISSISTSFSVGGAAGGSLSIPSVENPAIGVTQTTGATLQGLYQELPTFTFTPIQGNQYFKFLLTNMKLTQLSLLENWPFDFVMKTLVKKFGRLYNDPGDANKTYPDFLKLADLLSQIMQRREMDFFYQPLAQGNVDAYIMRLRYKNMQEAGQVEALLWGSNRIEAEGGKRITGFYRLVPAENFITAEKDEAGRPFVQVKLKSFMEVLSLLGQGVETPQDHIARGFVGKDRLAAGSPDPAAVFRVRQAAAEPRDAFIAVSYRNRWFYIKDEDIQSKQIFAFVNLLFSLQTQSVMGQNPALTIPVR